MATAEKRPRRFKYELVLVDQGITRIAGVDEAGRGPLAGPVFAGAVVFPLEWLLHGLPKPLRKIDDSKKLTHEQREELYEELMRRPEICCGVAAVDVDWIDRINILQATHRAMNLALEALGSPPQYVLVDGLKVNSLKFAHMPIVKGDALSYSIGAASILAKVRRDRLMTELDTKYPGYGFADHKGYGTPEHLAAIRQLGPCPIHRQSFAPMRPVQGEFGI